MEETVYECGNCGEPLDFNIKSLKFRHKALCSPCRAPIAVPVTVITGLIMPDVRHILGVL